MAFRIGALSNEVDAIIQADPMNPVFTANNNIAAGADWGLEVCNKEQLGRAVFGEVGWSEKA